MHFVLHCSFSFFSFSFLHDKEDRIPGEKITKKCLLTLILSLNSVRCGGTTQTELSRHTACTNGRPAVCLSICLLMCLSDTCVANKLQKYRPGCKLSKLVILYVCMLNFSQNERLCCWDMVTITCDEKYQISVSGNGRAESLYCL